MSKQLSTILFDLDGTIADTNEIILRTLEETLAHVSGRPWNRSAILPVWGIPLRMQLLALYPEIDIEVAIPFYRRRYAELHRTILGEFPGMRAVLEALRGANYRLGVVTSKKRAGAQETLQDIGYLPYFNVIVCEEDTPRLKPAADPLLIALRQFGVDAKNAAYVGDNPDDMHAAHAAGMQAVAVAWSLRGADGLQAAQPHVMLYESADLLRWLGFDTDALDSLSGTG